MQSHGGPREVPFEARYSDTGGGQYTIAMTIERVKQGFVRRSRNETSCATINLAFARFQSTLTGL